MWRSGCCHTAVTRALQPLSGCHRVVTRALQPLSGRCSRYQGVAQPLLGRYTRYTAHMEEQDARAASLSASLEAACSDPKKLALQLRSKVAEDALAETLDARAAPLDAEVSDLDARAGRTPLMAAARDGDADCVAALLAAGADPWVTDQMGRNALHHATENKHDDPSIAALLLVAAEQTAPTEEPTAGLAKLATQRNIANKLPHDLAVLHGSPRVGTVLRDALQNPDTLAGHREHASEQLGLKQSAWKAQMELQDRERHAHKLAKADKALPVDTAICVAGRGRGVYKGFKSRFVGANEHTIVFADEGSEETTSTVVVSLRDEKWTVYEHEMAEVAVQTPPSSGGRSRSWRMCCSTGAMNGAVIPEGIPPVEDDVFEQCSVPTHVVA
eukprot:COSAG02_NODE_14333_length_1283_cov_1.377534_1_plen_385_part_01